MSDPAPPAPGWYPDPANPPSSSRFWDGSAWTAQTSPRSEQEPARSGPEQAGPAPWGAGGPTEFAHPPAPPWRTDPPPVWGGGSGWGSYDYRPQAPPPPHGINPYSQAGPVPTSPYAGSAPVAPAWHTGPAAYQPAPEPKRRRTALIIAGVVVVGVIALVGVAAVAIPAVLRVSGVKWFRGGVPSSWSAVSVTGFSNEGHVVQAWKVPGPKFGPDTPFLTVVKLNLGQPAGETATQFLSSVVGEALRSEGAGEGQMVMLDNGAPAMEWTRPDTLSAAPSVPVTDYLVYAEISKTVYQLVFLTDTAHFALEVPGVKKVMFNFKGNGD